MSSLITSFKIKSFTPGVVSTPSCFHPNGVCSVLQQKRQMSKIVKRGLKAAATAAGGKIGWDAGSDAYSTAKEGAKAAISAVKTKASNMAGTADTASTTSKAASTSKTAKAVAQSPIQDWFSILNPEWFSRSPFSIENTYDGMTALIILLVLTIIIVLYGMWMSYWGNTATSFFMGEKKLPVFHLAIISISVLLSTLVVGLIYIVAFTTLMVEAASVSGLSADITHLQLEIQELRTLVEGYKKS
jgi:hypothetical protein